MILMQNNPMAGLLDQLLQRNPQIQTNPLAKNMMNVLQNGDAAKGEEIARNLCQSYGVSPEQAYNMAMQFFGRR